MSLEVVINGEASAGAWEKAWTAPTPRSQRGQPHVVGPLGLISTISNEGSVHFMTYKETMTADCLLRSWSEC